MGDQATAASEREKVSAASDDANGSEEIQAQRTLQSPVLPTLSELQKHRITHLPFRAWCPDCVEAFAREMAHRLSAHEKRDFPLISVDYFFLSSKGVVTRDEVDNQWDNPQTRLYAYWPAVAALRKRSLHMPCLRRATILTDMPRNACRTAYHGWATRE